MKKISLLIIGLLLWIPQGLAATKDISLNELTTCLQNSEMAEFLQADANITNDETQIQIITQSDYIGTHTLIIPYEDGIISYIFTPPYEMAKNFIDALWLSQTISCVIGLYEYDFEKFEAFFESDDIYTMNITTHGIELKMDTYHEEGEGYSYNATYYDTLKLNLIGGISGFENWTPPPPPGGNPNPPPSSNPNPPAGPNPGPDINNPQTGPLEISYLFAPLVLASLAYTIIKRINIFSL